MRFDQCGAVAQDCNSDAVQEKKSDSALEYSRDRRYLLFYFRYDTDIFKPGIVNTDTSKLNWPLKLLKEYNLKLNSLNIRF